MFWFVSSVFVTNTALGMPGNLPILFVPSARDGSRSPRHESIPRAYHSQVDNVSEDTTIYRDSGQDALVENGYTTVVGLSHVGSARELWR